MKLKNIFILLLTLLAFSCGDDEFPVPQSSSIDVKFASSISNSGFSPADVTFTNNSLLREGAGTPTYTWSFGDGTTSNEASPTHRYEQPGSYEVALVAVLEDDVDFAKKTIVIKDPEALQSELFVIDAADERIYNVGEGTFIDIDGFGTGIDFDATNELIYYTDADAGTLVKVSKDGTGKETVATGFSDPRDLALDIANGKAYVADRGAVEAIWEVNLSNGNKTTFYSSANNATFIDPVGIDLHNGNLYVTCVAIDAESVWKSPVTSGNFTRIINYSAGGYGYGIAIDKVNDKIYFDNDDNGEILMSDLSGNNITQFVTRANRVYGISVDNTNNKVYWSVRNSGSVYMADLDGSNQKTLTSDYTDPRGLFHIE